MGSKATPPPEPDDPAAEFRAAVGAVRPLRGGAPRAEPARRPPPARRPADAPPVPGLADLPPLQPGETVRWLKPGVPVRALRRLDGEDFAADAELDLHGLTVPQATRALHAFLDDCLHEGCERLRIIHGKGLRSPDPQPVLKGLVVASLKGHPAVLALRSAGRRDGASGAVRVLLRRA
ncbi:Smr/MutS family protein [Immundisolibacter sp.]|uniref:Smr/MutS family protein n=1 Tax=Immundisolibacter sp. TaxID=1934948 RepID=UPI003565DCB5